MNGPKQALTYYWAVPLLGGAVLLALSIFLIPRNVEISQALRHTIPHAGVNQRSALTIPIPPPSPSQLASILAHGDARAIAQAADALRATGHSITTLQIVHDLDRIGRAQVALDYLKSAPVPAAPGLWRIRFELTRKLGRTIDALAMLDSAVHRPSSVPPQDLIEAAYALNRPDLVIVGAEQTVLPPPDAARALDLARRFDAMDRPDLIMRLDKLSGRQWRRSDPWLAMRIARKAGLQDEALSFAMLLPAKQQDAARQSILGNGSDPAALRNMLIQKAASPRSDRQAIAEQLLAAGYRHEALAILEQGAAPLPVSHMLSQRLLYLMGPRPAAREIAWLKERALRGSASAQLDWINEYVQRDRPRSALAFLATHPLASKPDLLLVRLSLAQSAGDEMETTRLFAALLDQPILTADQVHILTNHVPAQASVTVTRKLAERRLQAGIGGLHDIMGLAWAAWNSGDVDETVKQLDIYLRTAPDDPIALRLMADATSKRKGQSAARPWRQRALAHTPPNSREQAELLESLQRYPEAIKVVDTLIAAKAKDRSLIAFKARLLLANGQPGHARKVLAP